ncbi:MULTISPECIES: putative holin-like toxin [Halobacillus]|uniref:Holin-like toxin n=1 Tax=Halobacillus naozhouensis TaxID=554880 RepID=A0ABY8IVQ9_9BACI|nr:MULTISPECIES: putative holin-like toxin [Halobacillus]WFT74279.1 putative holin-like toxin [Halobacillus naozhouensis]
MSVYEALMVAIAFSTLNVSLIALVVAISRKRK